MFDARKYREALDFLYRPGGQVQIDAARELSPLVPHLSVEQTRDLFEKAQFDNGGEAWLAVPGIRVSGAFHILKLSHEHHRTIRVTAWRMDRPVPYVKDALAFSEKAFGSSLETVLPNHCTRTFSVADFVHPMGPKGFFPGRPVSVYAGFDTDVEDLISKTGIVNANRFNRHLLYVVTSQTEAWELSNNMLGDRGTRTTNCDGESGSILHCGHCGGGIAVGGCRHCGRTSPCFNKRAPEPAFAIPTKIREAMETGGWKFATKRTPKRKF